MDGPGGCQLGRGWRCPAGESGRSEVDPCSGRYIRQSVTQLHPGEGFGTDGRSVTHLAPLSIAATPPAPSARDFSRSHLPTRVAERPSAAQHLQPGRPRKVV